MSSQPPDVRLTGHDIERHVHNVRLKPDKVRFQESQVPLEKKRIAGASPLCPDGATPLTIRD